MGVSAKLLRVLVVEDEVDGPTTSLREGATPGMAADVADDGSAGMERPMNPYDVLEP